MLQSASTATAHAIDLSCCVRIVSSLEIEIKAQHQAVVGEVRSIRRQAAAPNPGILVVPGKTGSAVHDRIVAIAKHVVIEIAEI